MSAIALLNSLYRGQCIYTDKVCVGLKPHSPEDMICDCDDDGECCGY